MLQAAPIPTSEKGDRMTKRTTKMIKNMEQIPYKERPGRAGLGMDKETTGGRQGKFKRSET